MISVAIVNRSTQLPDHEVRTVAGALAVQLERDVKPSWGWTAELSVVPSGAEPPADAWLLHLVDVGDRDGASGYHDVTADGRPFGKVVVMSGGRIDPDWSVAASHELIEMLGNPTSNRGFLVPSVAGGQTLYALEICDPCEAESFGYRIGGVKVSDFVYPSWYDPTQSAGSLFDYTSSMHRPLELLPGGFISRLEVPVGARWESVFAGDR